MTAGHLSDGGEIGPVNASSDQSGQKPLGPGLVPFFQGAFQFAVQVSEGPIAKDANNIIRNTVLLQVGANGIRIFAVDAVGVSRLNIRDQLFRVESLIDCEQIETSDLRDECAICECECVSQLSLENVATGGIATRFEGDPEFLLRIGYPKRVDGFANRRRMMSKVIDDRDLIHRGANLHATLDSFETS